MSTSEGRAREIFWVTVKASNSEKCWNTMPMPNSRAAAGLGTVTARPRQKR